MSDVSAATPIVFGDANTRCFGWFHPPQGQRRNLGVVLCLPLGYEGTCAYETYTQLAESLALRGLPVIRFDYHGTGDSGGSDVDPDRVKSWMGSIGEAVIALKQHGGVAHVALFGVRMGATLASKAASEIGGVDSLVLWAPCVTGRAFVRELRAAQSKLTSESIVDAGGIEALGFQYTAQTLEDLQVLDCQKFDIPPARRAMIIGRDDIAVDGPLPKTFEKCGIETNFSTLPGYANMIVEPHEGAVATETLDAITEWLLRSDNCLLNGQIASTKLNIENQTDSIFDGVREIPLIFGSDSNLFGILSEPLHLSETGREWETAILMLNVGTNHRVGPNRLYVKMARSWSSLGYRTFRFDLAGIGDSKSAAGYTGNRLYSKGSVVDVQAAMECLVQKGCKKFIIMGLCSGAYVAFQTALVDDRVFGQILMNPRRLEWKTGETLQSAMQISYNSMHFYRKAMLNPGVYLRVLRGEVDLKGIFGRMLVLVRARLNRALNAILRISPEDDDVLANMRLLSAKGIDTLMIIGADDDGRDYIEFHLGFQGNKMKGVKGFTMKIVNDADHTFSNSTSQNIVIEKISQHLRSLQ